jgi:hypothetical protein
MTLARWSVFVGASQSKLVDLIVRNGLNVSLVAGAVCLLVAGGPVLLIIGAALSLVGWLLTAWLLQREIRRKNGLLNIYVGAKLLLLIAAGAGYQARRPDDLAWIWASIGLGMLGILSEPTVRLLLSKAIPVAVNLPGTPVVPKPPVRNRQVARIPLAQAAAAGVLAVLALPGWVLLVLIALSLVPMLLLVRHAVRANVICTRQAKLVRDALEKYQPAFAVYYGSSVGATYQLGMWLPYLDRLNLPYIVISRVAHNLPEIRRLTSAPIVMPKSAGEVGTLQDMAASSLKAAFYVQGSSTNLQFQRFRQITHVWLNHGDSDKRANYSPAHATFDKVFVAGQQGVERYAKHGVRIAPSKMVIVGRPQIERIKPREQALPPGAPRTVLYAPTWQGGKPTTNYSSLPLGAKIVAALLERPATVIFRPHPFTYRDPRQTRLARAIQAMLKEDRERTGRKHVWGHQAEKAWDIPDCFNNSDALITDVSSVASDFLVTGKPLAMVAIQQSGEAFPAEIPMARVAYVIEKDLSTLDWAIDSLFGDDPLEEKRRAYRVYCLGERIGEHAAEGFLEAARCVIEGRRPPKEATNHRRGTRRARAASPIES